MKLRKLIAAVTASAIAVGMMAVTASADDAVVYGVENFEGLKLTSDNQYVDGYGIQRMGWSNAAYGNFTGSVIAIEDDALKVTGGTTAKGFQIQATNYAQTLKIEKIVGKEYKLVIEASAADADGIINIVPDNHPEGVAKTFDLTTEKSTFEIQYTLVEHQYNDIQISSDVDFIVHSIILYDAALLSGDTDGAEDDDTSDDDDASDDDDDTSDDDDAVAEDEDDDFADDEDDFADDDEVESDTTDEDATASDDSNAADDSDASETGATTIATTDKQSADTGIAGIAAITGLAVVAAGAIAVSRKRK